MQQVRARACVDKDNLVRIVGKYNPKYLPKAANDNDTMYMRLRNRYDRYFQQIGVYGAIGVMMIAASPIILAAGMWRLGEKVADFASKPGPSLYERLNNGPR